MRKFLSGCLSLIFGIGLGIGAATLVISLEVFRSFNSDNYPAWKCALIGLSIREHIKTVIVVL